MSKRVIALFMILVLTALCLAACGDKNAAVPTPSTAAVQETEEETTANELQTDAQAMRDYLGQYIDLSLYSESEGSNYEYTIALAPQTAIEHKLETITPEVVLPDYKNLKYGMQFKEMNDAGFVQISDDVEVEAQVGVPASLTVSKSPFITIDLGVFNPLSATANKSECVIDSYDVPVTEGLSFDYNGITNGSSLEDIFETFGAPDLSIQIKASEYEHTKDKGDNNIIRMYYDNRDADHTQTLITLVYDKEAGTASFDELSVFENDY